jgi:hypothetical protein
VDVEVVTPAGANSQTPADQYTYLAVVPQTISFTSTPPGNPVFGGNYKVAASGGASGNPVVLSIDSSSTSGACSISGATVSFTGTGTCTIDANQAGNNNYGAAPQAQQTLTIGKAPQTISFTSTPSANPVFGGNYKVAASGGGSGNPVVLSIDSSSTSGACSIASTTVSFTGVGSCVIDANQAGNNNYNAAPRVQQSFPIGRASSTTSYTGSQQVSTGASLAPAATLASAAGACRSAQHIAFTLSGNAITGAAGTYTLESASTNASGQATRGAISTAGWQTGSYTITATYAGTSDCAASAGSSAPLVTAPGLLAAGAGIYSLPSPVGQVTMGFFTARVPRKSNTYTGRLALVNRHRWMFNASITSYVTTSPPKGIVQGAGTLSWWNPSLHHRHGGWALAATRVAFTATFTPTSKTSPGTFGITIQRPPVSPQPTPLPNSSQTGLTKGTIVIRWPGHAARHRPRRHDGNGRRRPN